MVLVLNFIAKLSSLNSTALLACGAAAVYAIVLWHCLLAGACGGLSNVRCCRSWDFLLCLLLQPPAILDCDHCIVRSEWSVHSPSEVCEVRVCVNLRFAVKVELKTTASVCERECVLCSLLVFRRSVLVYIVLRCSVLSVN